MGTGISALNFDAVGALWRNFIVLLRRAWYLVLGSYFKLLLGFVISEAGRRQTTGANCSIAAARPQFNLEFGFQVFGAGDVAAAGAC
jgi:hypothetical protein